MIKPQKWKGIIDIKKYYKQKSIQTPSIFKDLRDGHLCCHDLTRFWGNVAAKALILIFFAGFMFFFLSFNTGQKAASRLRRQVEGERAGQDGPTRLWNSFGSSLWTKRPLCQKQKGKGSFEHSGPRPASVHATASAGDNRAAVSAERRRCTVDVARLHSESRHFSTAKHLRRDRARRPLEPHETHLTGDLASPMLLQADDKTQGERKENYNSHG